MDPRLSSGGMRAASSIHGMSPLPNYTRTTELHHDAPLQLLHSEDGQAFQHTVGRARGADLSTSDVARRRALGGHAASPVGRTTYMHICSKTPDVVGRPRSMCTHDVTMMCIGRERDHTRGRYRCRVTLINDRPYS